MKLKYSQEDNAYDAGTDDDDDNGDDNKDVKENKIKKKENNTNLSIRYDGFEHFSCDKYGQRFANQESLERHIIHKKHSQFEQYECLYCVKVFPTQDALDNHFHQIHAITKKHSTQCTSRITYTHPFTMIVAGPTRSGKTNWVARLLHNCLKQIKPITSRILYCYMYWQPM